MHSDFPEEVRWKEALVWMGRDRGGKVEAQAVSDASRALESARGEQQALPRPPPRAEQPVMALHTQTLTWATAATAQRGVSLNCPSQPATAP